MDQAIILSNAMQMASSIANFKLSGKVVVINASQEQNYKDTSNHIGGVEGIIEAFITSGALINYGIPYLR